MEQTKIIDGRYRLDAIIGYGGMGTVYRATDLVSSATVAVKYLRPEVIAANPQAIDRFLREADALRQLNHPNIVQIIATIKDADSYFLVTEYLQGGDLGALIRSKGRLSVARTLEIGLDLADALTRSHRLKIVHRDLKPANVLLAADGSPRLSDFGIARLGDRMALTDTELTIGTLDYMPPEAFSGGEQDALADIWAFGVLLFEMVAGERPFKGDHLSHLIQTILNQPVPDLETVRPDLPTGLVDLIYRMLSKDRESRIPSARQVGLELDALLHGYQPVSSHSTRVIFESERFGTSTTLTTPHNLPAQTTAFVGRESELAALAGLLSAPENRLVTILAPGGMGKTRLSVEAARAQMLYFPNGVYFVALAPLATLDGMINAIGQAIDYPFQAGEPRKQLLDTLRDKHLLLVMDNFEHVIEHGGLVADILTAAPEVRVLVTSRQRLNQSGEVIFTLEGMDFPAWETPEDALNYSTVKLFMQGAKRARPNFELSADQLLYVARICRMVQGMPLGIVLAASWVEMLSPQEIAEEMAGSLDFLETEMTDIPERQRSLRAVFDYSWQLMTPAEQAMFARLAVFRGGFTRETAQAVAGANLRALMALVNKSLLRRDPESGRYSIHELLRQYAEEKLGSEAEAARAAHSRTMLTLLLEREADIKGRDQIGALKAIDAEFENIYAGWLYALDTRQFDLIAPVLEAFSGYCLFRSRQSEGLPLLKQTCERLEHGVLWARAALRAQRLLHRGDEVQLQEILGYLRPQGDSVDLALCLLELALLRLGTVDRDGMLTFATEALEVARRVGDPFYIPLMLQLNGIAYGARREVEKAADLLLQAVEGFRAVGNRFGLTGALLSLSGYSSYYGLPRTIEFVEEALVIARTIDYRALEVIGLANLAIKSTLLRQFDRAREALDSAEIKAKQLSRFFLGSVYDARVVLYTASGEYREALGAGEAMLATGWGNPDQRGHATAFLSLAHLGLEAWEDARRCAIEGLRSINPATRRLAMTVPLAVLAALAIDQPDETAVAHLSAAFAPDNIYTSGLLAHHPVLTRLRDSLRQQLGEAAYESAWARGQTLDLVEVAETLLQRFA